MHNFKHTDWPQPSGLFQFNTTENSVKVKRKIKEKMKGERYHEISVLWESLFFKLLGFS